MAGMSPAQRLQEVPSMKRLLAAATIGLMCLAMAASSSAKRPAPQVQRLERRIAWSEQHIRQLNHRRDYLHRYIKDLRAKLHPSPASSGTTTSSGGSTPISTTSSGGWSDELAAAGFPSSAIPHMLYIIQRESGGDPNAINPSSGACGLTQLYPCYGGSAWLDPMTNLRLAHQKYEASGFAPWGG